MTGLSHWCTNRGRTIRVNPQPKPPTQTTGNRYFL
jgi:hypothetical protein